MKMNTAGNSYAKFLSEFMQKEDTRTLSFGDASKQAAAQWRALPLPDKLKYKVMRDKPSTSIGEHRNLCAVCGRGFKTPAKMRFHFKTCGSQFPCNICGKLLKTLDTMQRHKRFVHNKEQSFMCPLCQKVFSCGVDLRIHHNIHKEMRFKCMQCEKTYSNKSNLSKHCKKKHV